ncbi:hypothetical protein PT277_06455 [Acetobacteraceae bacterium ESL0709]|nr:hypothetical protein [Acetobacteraceae bacterium ESL0697]MDF7678338.1 hypothetical protein [Acetobacteraceae bacterium ESL0709]
MKHRFLLLGAVILVSGSPVSPSYAQWVSYPGSSEVVREATGKPADDMGTKNYRPESHPPEASTYPHWDPIIINGDQAGRIDQNGEVYNRSGDSVGIVDPKNGTFIYNNGMVGRIDSGGDIHDSSGRIIASTGSSGNVIINGDQAGRVDSQGTVYDSSGSAIGQVPAGSNAVGALMLLQNQNK